MDEPFVGRATELRAIAGHLDAARTGMPQHVLVTGPAGEGKTMLLRRASADAAAAGFEVLRLAGESRRTPLPVDDLRELLEWTAARAPILVAVDDLELLEQQSADGVLFVMRHLRRHPVLVIATSRSDDDGAWALADDLRRLHDAGDIAQLALAPFGEEDVAALAVARLGREPDELLVELLWRRTGGSPFFAVELLDALSTTALVALPDGRVTCRSADEPLPRRVATTVLHRVFRLGPDARRVACAVAVLGTVPLERLGILATVTVASEERVEAAFDRLVRARVLVLDGGSYRISHAIVADALRSDLGTAARRRLHSTIARALADRRDAGDQTDVIEIAGHVRAGTPGLDPAAAAWLVEAGDAVARSAPADAAAWYRDALARLDLADPAAVEAQLRLSRALDLAAAESIVMGAPADAPRAGLDVTLASCLVSAFELEPSDAVATAEAARPDAAMAAWFRGAAAWARLRLGHLDAAIRDADLARRAVEPAGGDVLSGLIASVLVIGHAERGDLDDAAEALDWGRTLPVSMFESGLDCASARLHVFEGRYDRAAELLARAEAREAARGRVGMLAMTLAARVEAASLAGDVATARAANDRLQVVPRDAAAVAMNSWCLMADATARRDLDATLRAHRYARDRGLGLDAARALALAGDIAGDVAMLAEAHDRFARLGAVTRQRWIAGRLDSPGQRTRHRRLHPAQALTDIEVVVSEHVAQGLTNRQVGAEMNLSPKTIEVYLSRIYAKTGCRSRVDLAVAVRNGTVAGSTTGGPQGSATDRETPTSAEPASMSQ